MDKIAGEKMVGPLNGIRVIDCTHWIFGPVTCAILGDLGADVIKIEDPIRGDPMRGVREFEIAHSMKQKIPYVWEYCNRNKRGMTLDLHNDASRKIMQRLVQKADVLVQNFRSHNVAQKLGVDYCTISSCNPNIIYSGLSAWGPEGPDAEIPALEPTVSARSGLKYHAGEPGSPPLIYKIGVVDPIGGAVAVIPILAALLARDRQGKGQEIDTSLLGSVMYTIESLTISCTLLNGVEPPRKCRDRMPNPLWMISYKCADDKMIELGLIQADRYWSTFCNVVGRPELEKDPMFENMEIRAQHSEKLISILDELFATKPRHKWEEIFRKADLIYAPVQTITELINDPQVIANNYIIDLDHPNYGPVKMVGFPFRLSKTPASLKRPAPEHGQHTEEILLELGYTWSDIVELKDKKVV